MIEVRIVDGGSTLLTKRVTRTSSKEPRRYRDSDEFQDV